MKTLRFLPLLFVCLAMISCGFGRQATGVVVWTSKPEVLPNGTIVWIWDQSRIRKTFKVQAESGGETLEIEAWRVKSFADGAAARQFAQDFAPWKNSFARSEKQGLPLRESPDATSARLYKLGENEETKILQKSKEKVLQGNLEGSWVWLLTKDGYSGWAFDYYLAFEEVVDGVKKDLKTSGPADPNTQKLVEDPWYPESYQGMIEQSRLDLDRFKPEYGMRSTGQALQIVWPVEPSSDAPSTAESESSATNQERYELPFASLKKINEFTYQTEGEIPVKLTYKDVEHKKIEVQFRWKGESKTLTLVHLEQDVGTLISQELAYRQQRLTELVRKGKILTSPTYGTITLQSDGSFEWVGFDVLKAPQGSLFPENVKDKGKLHFDWFRDRQLLGDYQIVRFEIEGETAPVSQVFLYRFIKDGVQFLPVTATELDPRLKTVLREGRTGLSLFFHFSS